MAFNKWTKQIPQKEDEDPSTLMQSKNRSDLVAIQDKINKALQDIDEIYDEQSTDDSLVRDIEIQIRNMENGQFKTNLTSFLNKYYMREAHVQEVDQDRNQVLEDLADWFQMDHLEGFDLDGGVSSAMTEAKVGFSKLQLLNNEMKAMSPNEDGFKEIRRERERLQKMAIESFKNAKEVARRSSIEQQTVQPTAKKENGNVWKHAAGEIVDMFNKIRAEGNDNTAALQLKVKELLKNGERLSQKVTRLQEALEEKKRLEKGWTRENSVLVKEKTALQAKLLQIKKELVSTRKALNRHEAQSRSRSEKSGMDVKQEDLDKISDNLDNTTKEHKVLKQEVQILRGRLASFEKLMEEKDEMLFNLEHEKEELLHQMEQASVLSDGSAVGGISQTITRVSSNYIPNEKEVLKSTHAPKCSECGKMITANERVKEPPADPARKRASKKGRAKLSTQEPESDKEKSQEIEMANLRGQITILQQQLTSAHREIINMKVAKATTQVPHPTPDPTAEIGPISPRPTLETITTLPPIIPAVLEITPDDREEIGSSSLDTLPTKSSVEVAEEEIEASWGALKIREESPPPSASATALVPLPGEYMNRGMQTDPKFDPLSNWAQVIPAEQGWRPPLPPPGWLEFDPTLDSFKEKYTIKKAMLKGVQPSEIKQEVDHAADFIQKEMTRVVQGITGFREYIVTMAESNIRKMAAANNKLRTYLSQEEASILDQKCEKWDQPSQIGVSLPESDIASMKTQSLSHRSRKHGEVESSKDSDDKCMELRSLTLKPHTKVKVNIGIVAEKAVLMLEEAMRLLQDSINVQYDRYESIYTTLQKREAGFKYVFDEEDEPEIKLEIKRTFSQSDLDNLRREQEEMDAGIDKGSKIPKNQVDIQRSHSDIVISRQSTEPGLPIDQSVHSSRKEFQVAQATFQKKGTIQISTKHHINSLKEFDIGNIKDVFRRKNKPAPINNQKLMSAQTNLVQKDKKQSHVPREGRTYKPKKREGKNMPAFTFADLEKNADELKESFLSAEHTKALNKTADFRGETGQGMFPPIQSNPALAKKHPAPNMKFPTINKI